MTTQQSKRKFYLDTEDTLDEVGITRRQLSYWREKGLITPELGAEAKRYTERDIERLKFLRKLIEEQKFPIDAVKRFVSDKLFGTTDLDAYRYVDLASGELVNKRFLFERLWNEFGATADEREVEDRFYALAVLLFRLVLLRYDTPAAYKERHDEILGKVRSLAFGSRIGLRYNLDGSPDAQPDLVMPREEWEDYAPRHWFKQAVTRLEGFETAARSLLGERDPKRARFWDDLVKEELKSARTNDFDDSDLDDVPF